MIADWSHDTANIEGSKIMRIRLSGQEINRVYIILRGYIEKEKKNRNTNVNHLSPKLLQINQLEIARPV